ncbi:hypothetical protein [Candidatus Nesciobacter abundans]|uniref:Uncharacterized protein n=1 Tax=Candidatus Nesciobacter abundans TaxID=2601668 RepID=A0A5C0UHG5_9PROT|nr:hypothetical protein [Candidatus Nesciobacter abundans]QEK39121.1 hypothetical protein FZC36_01565 [Candidatus Nesciobacter abundans]
MFLKSLLLFTTLVSTSLSSKTYVSKSRQAFNANSGTKFSLKLSTEMESIYSSQDEKPVNYLVSKSKVADETALNNIEIKIRDGLLTEKVDKKPFDNLYFKIGKVVFGLSHENESKLTFGIETKIKLIPENFAVKNLYVYFKQAYGKNDSQDLYICLGSLKGAEDDIAFYSTSLISDKFESFFSSRETLPSPNVISSPVSMTTSGDAAKIYLKNISKISSKDTLKVGLSYAPEVGNMGSSYTNTKINKYSKKTNHVAFATCLEKSVSDHDTMILGANIGSYARHNNEYALFNRNTCANIGIGYKNSSFSAGTSFQYNFSKDVEKYLKTIDFQGLTEGKTKNSEELLLLNHDKSKGNGGSSACFTLRYIFPRGVLHRSEFAFSYLFSSRETEFSIDSQSVLATSHVFCLGFSKPVHKNADAGIRLTINRSQNKADLVEKIYSEVCNGKLNDSERTLNHMKESNGLELAFFLKAKLSKITK